MQVWLKVEEVEESGVHTKEGMVIKKGNMTMGKDGWFFSLRVFVGLQKWGISCPLPSKAGPTDWQWVVFSGDFEGVVF